MRTFDWGVKIPLTPRKTKIQYRPRQVVGSIMANKKSGAHVIRSLVIEDGMVKADTRLSSYRRGLATALDITPPQLVVSPLAKGEPTRLAFERLGAALKGSLSKARSRYAE